VLQNNNTTKPLTLKEDYKLHPHYLGKIGAKTRGENEKMFISKKEGGGGYCKH